MLDEIIRSLATIAPTATIALIAKSTAAMLLGLTLLAITRRASAALRHLLLIQLFGFLIMLPLLTIIVPEKRIEVQWVAPVAETQIVTEEATPRHASETDAAKSVVPVRGGRVADWRTTARNLFLLGLGIGLFSMVVGLFRLRWYRQSATVWSSPLVDAMRRDAGIRRPVRVLLCPDIAVPLTYGLVRPTILLPAESEQWSEQDVLAALVHEMEHVRRGDWIVQIVARVIAVWYWPNPLVWIALRRLALEAETVVEMQSEAGAAGTVHGALQAGALATTFTASQGLLLMIPNMNKIAGELTAHCMHVAARTIATHALSIFGDHSDVMACRQIGFGLMSSASVQEAHDFALIAQIASFRSRIPFLHFFDGFRTSHEVAKIDVLSDDDLRALFPEDLVRQHRDRALTPDRPVLRGSAQNPDTFFQAREASNPFYDTCAGHVAEAMVDFAERTGRKYGLFDYFGHPEAERVIVLMGSGGETVRETVDYLVSKGEKVGVVAVRLYRPFSVEHFIGTLPKSVKSIAVLDRTKEPEAIGDPLYLDVIAALREAEDLEQLPFTMPRVIAGRYGLSSKEFTPAMVKAVIDELKAERPRRRFTVGIVDDITHRSLEYDPEFDIEPDDVVRAVFFGLGADGTVGMSGWRRRLRWRREASRQESTCTVRAR